MLFVNKIRYCEFSEIVKKFIYFSQHNPYIYYLPVKTTTKLLNGWFMCILFVRYITFVCIRMGKLLWS